MNFINSLDKKYYYSIEEAIKNPSKKKLWDENRQRIAEIKEHLNINFDVTSIFIINEFLEKNSISNTIDILVEIDEKDLDEIINEKITCFIKVHDDIYYLDDNVLSESNLEIGKACPLRT